MYLNIVCCRDPLNFQFTYLPPKAPLVLTIRIRLTLFFFPTRRKYLFPRGRRAFLLFFFFFYLLQIYRTKTQLSVYLHWLATLIQCHMPSAGCLSSFYLPFHSLFFVWFSLRKKGCSPLVDGRDRGGGADSLHFCSFHKNSTLGLFFI